MAPPAAARKHHLPAAIRPRCRRHPRRALQNVPILAKARFRLINSDCRGVAFGERGALLPGNSATSPKSRKNMAARRPAKEAHTTASSIDRTTPAAESRLLVAFRKIEKLPLFHGLMEQTYRSEAGLARSLRPPDRYSMSSFRAGVVPRRPVPTRDTTDASRSRRLVAARLEAVHVPTTGPETMRYDGPDG